MPESPEPAAEQDTDGATEQDLKSQFRAALARKNARSTGGESHLANNSKVHDTQGRAGGKRQFRRKSG